MFQIFDSVLCYSNLLLIISNVVFISVIYSLFLTGSFYVCISIFVCNFSWRSLSILITCVLKSAYSISVVSILFSFFFRSFIVFFHLRYVLLLLFIVLCIGSFILGKAATSPSLGRVTLCSGCPVRPSGIVFLVT